MANKYAICLLAFTNEIYLVGALLASFVHRQYIKKFNLKIDLVIMINDTFIPYIKYLEEIFNKVKVIEMIEIKLSTEDKMHAKYVNWMKYSVNKWQALNFDEYDKILFTDTEIIPLSESWYTDIFNLNAPAVLSRYATQYGQQLSQSMITNKKIVTAEDYRTCSEHFTFFIDGGLVLLKPSKTLYIEYINFLKFVEGTEGYISNIKAGADETTLILFMIFYKKIVTVLIPYKYSVITWDRYKYDKQTVKGLNFSCLIKPWVKPRIIQWSDENIFHDIAKQMFKTYNMRIIKKIYMKLQVENLIIYSYVVRNKLFRDYPYNYDALKNKNTKKEFMEFLNQLDNKAQTQFTYDELKQTIKKANLKADYMNKITQVDQSYVKKIINKTGDI